MTVCHGLATDLHTLMNYNCGKQYLLKKTLNSAKGFFACSEYFLPEISHLIFSFIADVLSTPLPLNHTAPVSTEKSTKSLERWEDLDVRFPIT